MKYEPLKGKERVIQYIGNIRRMDGGIHRIPFIKRGFLTDDVKSAVQGLIRELEQEVSKEEDTVLDKSYVIHRIVIPSVKKWFADVINKEAEK